MVLTRTILLLAATAAAVATTEASTHGAKHHVTVKHSKHSVASEHKVHAHTKYHVPAHQKYAVHTPAAKHTTHTTTHNKPTAKHTTHKATHGKQAAQTKDEVTKKFPHGQTRYVKHESKAAVAKPAHKKTHGHKKTAKEEEKPAETPADKPAETPAEKPASDANGNEVVKKFPHGKVQYVANNAKAAAPSETKPAHKKTHGHKKSHDHKKVAKQVETPAPTEEEADAAIEELAEDAAANEEGLVDATEEDAEEESFQLKVGETVDITVGGEKWTLEHFANGSTIIKYPNGTNELVDLKDILLDFEVDGEESDDAGSATEEAGSISGSSASDPSVGQEDSAVEGESSTLAKKFTEFATKLTGSGMKEAVPVIFIGSAIGALAAVVGIAAVAVGRARRNAAEPQSVLADATADVEAAATEEKKEDEKADDSESDSDNENSASV